MARITIEDCLEKVPSRFQLVHMAAKRVRQIREGSEYLVSSPKNEDIVVALREIAADKVRINSSQAETEAVAKLADADEVPAIEDTAEPADSEAAAEPAE